MYAIFDRIERFEVILIWLVSSIEILNWSFLKFHCNLSIFMLQSLSKINVPLINLLLTELLETHLYKTNPALFKIVLISSLMTTNSWICSCDEIVDVEVC